MKPYSVEGGDGLGFFVTETNRHVIRAFIESQDSPSVTVENWTTGEKYTTPRVVVMAMNGIPDAYIRSVFHEQGLEPYINACFALGARLTLSTYTVRDNRVSWERRDNTALTIEVPAGAATVETVHIAFFDLIKEKGGDKNLAEHAWNELFQRACAVAFKKACGVPDLPSEDDPVAAEETAVARDAKSKQAYDALVA